MLVFTRLPTMKFLASRAVVLNQGQFFSRDIGSCLEYRALVMA